MIIFQKKYGGEDLCDVYRDVSEAFDEDFNLEMDHVPQDEHGFCKGTFNVMITWTERE